MIGTGVFCRRLPWNSWEGCLFRHSPQALIILIDNFPFEYLDTDRAEFIVDLNVPTLFKHGDQ